MILFKIYFIYKNMIKTSNNIYNNQIIETKQNKNKQILINYIINFINYYMIL